MTLLYLDFETHYEPRGDYSLRHMPTLQYVRDARFECLGLAIRHGDRPTAWIKPGMVREWAAFVDWDKTVAVAHNASFDGAILADRFGHRPAFWLDTKAWTSYAISQGVLPADARTNLAWWGEFLGMAKGDTEQAVGAGGDELAEYGKRDVEIMIKVHHWLNRHCPLTDLELRAIDLHVRMATEPRLALDTALLQSLATQVAPEAAILRKRDAFAQALRHYGVEPGVKTSPRTGKQTYAFAKSDAFMQSLMTHPDARVRLLHELRTEGASTIVASRAQRLLDVGEPCPSPLIYYGAHTGRASGADKMNMQNLPRGDFRNALMAPPGKVLIVADYSQIEARVVMWGAQDPYGLSLFQSGRDPYREFAANEMYNCAYDEVDTEMRRRAKPPVLALGFFQGCNGLVTYAAGIGVTMDHREAEPIHAEWHRRRPVWREWGRALHREAVNNGELTLPSGRKLTYPDITAHGRDVSYLRHKIFSKTAGRDRANLWHGLVVENWTQAVARDIIYHAAVRMPCPVVMMVHDEVVMVGTEDDVPAVREAMLTLPAWAEGLPVACEISTATRYGEAK